MLLLVAAVLVVLWLLGLFGHIAGGFINLLLIVALIAFIIHLFSGRSSTV